jgi:predicted peptidase
MRTSGFILLRTVVLAFIVTADTGFLDRSVTVDGNTYRYQVYVPANYTASKQWPMIVYLHGNGSQGSEGTLQTQQGMGDMVRLHRDAVPAIVVFPQAAPSEFWEQPPMQKLVIAELDATEKEFRIDSARDYLTGFSMGAAGAYRLAYKWPDRFAALVTDAGTVEPVPARGAPDRPDIDKRANPFTADADAFMALATHIKHLPIWIFHGDSDAVVPVEQSQRLAAALKTVSADVRFTEIPGVGHVDGAERVFRSVEIVNWLLLQHR